MRYLILKHPLYDTTVVYHADSYPPYSPSLTHTRNGLTTRAQMEQALRTTLLPSCTECHREETAIAANYRPCVSYLREKYKVCQAQQGSI